MGEAFANILHNELNPEPEPEPELPQHWSTVDTDNAIDTLDEYELTTIGGHVFRGKSLTEVVETWSRRKHSLSHNYADAKIESIKQK